MPAALVQWQFTYYYWVCCYTLSCLILTRTKQRASDVNLCLMYYNCMHLFVFMEVGIEGRRGVILIPPVCFTCLCSFLLFQCQCLPSCAPCYSWPAFYIFLLICAIIKCLVIHVYSRELLLHVGWTDSVVIAEVRIHLVLVLTIFHI